MKPVYHEYKKNRKSIMPSLSQRSLLFKCFPCTFQVRIINFWKSFRLFIIFLHEQKSYSIGKTYFRSAKVYVKTNYRNQIIRVTKRTSIVHVEMHFRRKVENQATIARTFSSVKLNNCQTE